MRAHSVTTNERARWPTPQAMNMYDMRHLAPSTGRRTDEGIQPAAQLIVSSVDGLLCADGVYGLPVGYAKP